MDTYWHRLCKNLPPSLAGEGRKLLKATGQRPPVARYMRLWQLIKPQGQIAEGLALLTEGSRLWPRALSLKLELARLYLDQGDGRRVTMLLSLADAQKDPACGWVVLKGALLCGKVEWLRVLAPSLVIAKLDKSAAEQECLALCRQEHWQDAADAVRRHHGLPPAPLRPPPPPSPSAPAQPSEPAHGDFGAFAACRGADVANLSEWLAAEDPQQLAWQKGEDRLTSAGRATLDAQTPQEDQSAAGPKSEAATKPLADPRAVLVKRLLAAARRT